MKPFDLSGLIKGLMVVIGIALALGRLDELKRWAAREAFGVQLLKQTYAKKPEGDGYGRTRQRKTHEGSQGRGL